jgi:hypothetical protein
VLLSFESSLALRAESARCVPALNPPELLRPTLLLKATGYREARHHTPCRRRPNGGPAKPSGSVTRSGAASTTSICLDQAIASANHTPLPEV